MAQNLDPSSGDLVTFFSTLLIFFEIIAFVVKKIYDSFSEKSDDLDRHNFVTATVFYYYVVCLIMHFAILEFAFKDVQSETAFNSIAIIILSAVAALSITARMIMRFTVSFLKGKKEKKLKLLIKKHSVAFSVGNFVISVLIYLLSRFIFVS